MNRPEYQKWNVEIFRNTKLAPITEQTVTKSPERKNSKDSDFVDGKQTNGKAKGVKQQRNVVSPKRKRFVASSVFGKTFAETCNLSSFCKISQESVD